MKENSTNQTQANELVATEFVNAPKTTALEVAVPVIVMPTIDQMNSLDELKPNFSLNLKYKSADDWAAHKDKPIRAFYNGLKEIPNDKGELITCGIFIAKHECFIAGPMLLVEAVRSLSVGTPLEITYRGKSTNKTGEGSTMKFDVIVLS